MELSSNPIGSWREKKPLIGRKDFHKSSLAKGNQFKEGSSEKLLGAWDFCLLGVWNVVCVIRRMGGMEKLVEFVWMCIAYGHNDVCKQKEHERKLGVKNRSWNFMEYYRWTNIWTFFTIFVPPKSTIEFMSNFNQS